MIVCGMCGKVFARKPKGPAPKWCSDACRQRAHRERHGPCPLCHGSGLARATVDE